MKIALFGATQGTGKEVVKQALAQGYTVRALARNPADLAVARGLTVVAGNVLDLAQTADTLVGADAVICTLGKTANNPADVVSQGTANIVTAMRRSGVKRLIVLSSIGVGDSKAMAPFYFRVLTWTVLRGTMQDKEAQEALVRQSGLQWTIVRAGGLTNGAQTGQYQHGPAQSIKAGRISRADVADFLLHQIIEETYMYRAVSIS